MNIEKYDSILKTELVKLAVVFGVLLLLLACVVWIYIPQMKKRKRKSTYIQLGLLVLVFSFLLVSLGIQIGSYGKDLADHSYIRYERAIQVRKRRQWVLGGVPTSYSEYEISFEYEGVRYALFATRDPGADGEADNYYIVFSEHSECILEIGCGAPDASKDLP